MAELYRKRGRVLRYDNGFRIDVAESGEAVESGDTFLCRPVEGEALPRIDSAAIDDVVSKVQSMVEPPLEIERLIISDGVAEHDFEGVQWRESSRRVHLAIRRATLRALVDLGDFDLDDLSLIARALRDAGAEREPPSRLRLAKSVSAALLPSLVGVAPPNVRLFQGAGGTDGKGHPIEEAELQGEPWPNWYRPSYRVRPMRAPLNLRASFVVHQIDRDLPQAIALLAPVDGLTMRVLCTDGHSSWPVTLRVSRIDGIATEARWYPYAAGSFGAEMML